MTQPGRSADNPHPHLRVLSQLIAQCYRDGFVPLEVASAVSVILPNVAWLGLSLPYQDHEGDHYIVSVNNLASSGTTRVTCLAATDTAATLAIRNAVPCISSMPEYDDLVDAFDQHSAGVTITMPIGSRPSDVLTPSGVRTQSGPAVAALSVGYASGTPVTEGDLLTASNLAAQLSPFVAALLTTVLPDLMHNCACAADDAAPRRGARRLGSRPPRPALPLAASSQDSLLVLDGLRAPPRNGRRCRTVLHPLWTAAWLRTQRDTAASREMERTTQQLMAQCKIGERKTDSQGKGDLAGYG